MKNLQVSLIKRWNASQNYDEIEHTYMAMKRHKLAMANQLPVYKNKTTVIYNKFVKMVKQLFESKNKKEGEQHLTRMR